MAKKKSIANIKIKKTPMLRLSRKPVRVGNNFGMGFSAFLVALFELNENKARSQKMTDAEIARQVRKEFTKQAKISKRFSTRNPNLGSIVQKHRSEYNRGVLTASIPPPTRDMLSFQYDDNGDAINPRHIPYKVLTEKQKEEKREKYYTLYRKPWEEKHPA